MLSLIDFNLKKIVFIKKKKQKNHVTTVTKPNDHLKSKSFLRKCCSNGSWPSSCYWADLIGN